MDRSSIWFLLQLLAATTAYAVKDALPDKYVTTWTAWSRWTACATCGQRVTRRYRECVGQLEDHTVFRVKTEECPGVSRVYKPCDNKPCVRQQAGSRKYQCSIKATQRSVPEHFIGKPWNPYIVDSYPCKLFCQPDGFNNFWSFGNVSDGTTCRTLKTKEGVCTKGKCLEVGCDGVALSEARLDMCLVCGGRNRSCTYINDEFRVLKQPGKLGYSDVVKLPTGATNIHFMDSKNVLATQLYVQENIFALQDSGKFYLLNSFRWYGFNGPLKLAGADVKFYFSRDGEKSVHIVGPLKEPLLVMVLQTNPYVHIKYGYWLSDEAAKLGSSARPKVTTTPEPKAAVYQFKAVGDQSVAPVAPKKEENSAAVENEVTLRKKERRRKYRRRKASRGKKCLTKPKGADGKTLKFKSKLAKLHYIYCHSEFVGTVTVLSKRRYRGETRYEVDLKSTVKNTMSMAKREYLWRDRDCQGIKLRPNKVYFVMVRTRTDMRKRLTRFMIDEGSFVRKLTSKSDRMLRAVVAGVQCNT
ncbi:ADAMTS-like protein 5 [Lineus longissimus]|uniref:ADAMTS-like protein 5 n=1 Tax=Lineus longissimus TaxID=88925 RepID=UPI002B4CA6B4